MLKTQNSSVSMLVHYSSVLFSNSSKGFCVSYIHLGNRESVPGEESTIKDTADINSPSIVLERETAFQVWDIICLFLEQLAFKAYRSEFTQKLLGNLCKIMWFASY